MNRSNDFHELAEQKIKFFVKKPEKGIHSEMHALAKEVSEYCGEPKKFAMYLGVIKNIGLPRAYRIFSEIRQSKEIKTPGKLFLYLSANNPAKRQGIIDNSKKKNKKPLRQGGANKTNKNHLPDSNKKVGSRKKRNGNYAIG